MSSFLSRVVCVFIFASVAVEAHATVAALQVSHSINRPVLRYKVNEPVYLGVTNSGGVATDVRLVYTATGGEVVLARPGTGWFCDAPSGGQIVCVFNNLQPGAASTSLSLVVNPTSLGTQKFASRVDITSVTAPEPDTSNNSAGSVHDVRWETATSITSVTPTPSAVGQDVTVKFRVVTHFNTPISSGNLVVRDGTTVVATVPVVEGVATYVTSALALGNHSLTGEFPTSGNCLGSVSQAVAHRVAHPVTHAITSSANPVQYGTGSRITSTVSSPAGTPTGYVVFYKQGSRVARLALTNGTASYDISPAHPPTTGEVRAYYEGNSTFVPANSNVIQQVITKAPATVSLSTSDADTLYGHTITLTAQATGTRAIPTGMVRFKRGTQILDTVALTSGVAKLSWYARPAGTHELQAEYLGSDYYMPATSPGVAQTVRKWPSTTTLTASANPSLRNQDVTFTASIEGSSIGAVKFYRGTTLLQTKELDSKMYVTYSTSSLPVGTHNIRAVFTGTEFALASSASLQQVVNRLPTVTSLATSANPSASGRPLTFTASVSASEGPVSGSVTFKSGQTALRTLSLVDGSAALTLSGLTIGTHTITATYNGSATLQPSTSAGIAQQIQRGTDATITALTRACASTAGHTASVPLQSGVNYQWSITGGTITSGAGTNRITFDTGAGPEYMTRLTATVSCDVCTTASDTLDISLSGASGVGVRQLRGHGLNDLLWQDHSTGSTHIWAMQGTTQGSVIAISSPGADWEASGIFDGNADGKGDILYRNRQTGTAMVWLMNGTTNIGSITFAAPTDLAWKLGGIADFNCDGSPDVVWNNPATRASVIWLMDRNALRQVVALPAMTSGWTINAVADFNRDSHPDIVWRRTTDGRNAVWTMKSFTPTSTLFMTSQPDLNWALGAIADYSGDGRPDLVWRNTTTGANQIWVMDGVTLTSVVPLTPVYDANIGIAGPR